MKDLPDFIGNTLDSTGFMAPTSPPLKLGNLSEYAMAVRHLFPLSAWTSPPPSLNRKVAGKHGSLINASI